MSGRLIRGVSVEILAEQVTDGPTRDPALDRIKQAALRYPPMPRAAVFRFESGYHLQVVTVNTELSLHMFKQVQTDRRTHGMF